ncbi:hypothetical protein SAMN05421541_112202 [Actinoplanes philippinensis]|uniref:Uncharacterized protein n=1 Tax=Actinoplanes philippinensis TaxID=35752 RepID=A0A1I2JGM9_9ACTN|nr:hypothetical protein [Actinoplanes philippinensis]SFF53013.1 hypothetical protein SAMN05421541_112202 [Actinoplanes philippinensis]
MAAVTGPGYGYPPPEGTGPRRRWLWAAVGIWGVVLIGIGFWSVRNDPPTVPEQRDVGRAVAVLRVASGAVVAAAQDERWVLSLGALQVEKCAITPVWDGQEASRAVGLYVPEGDARAALDTVVKRLPADYRAGVVTSRGGTRLTFFADAGEQVGIESEANSADHLLTLRVFTGCRPAVGDLDLTDPPAGAAPAVLDSTVAAITAGSTAPASASPAATPGAEGVAAEARAVACPGGGTMSTFVRDAGPAAPESGPKGVPEGTVPVWSDAGGWAYRSGSESVVVTADRDRFRVSVTTACRAG